MPLRFLIVPAVLIAATLPTFAQADAPSGQAAAEVIWVDTFADIPAPRPTACIGNMSAMYCHVADGTVYAVRAGLAPITTGQPLETAINPGQGPRPSAGGHGVAPRG